MKVWAKLIQSNWRNIDIKSLYIKLLVIKLPTMEDDNKTLLKIMGCPCYFWGQWNFPEWETYDKFFFLLQCDSLSTTPKSGCCMSPDILSVLDKELLTCERKGVNSHNTHSIFMCQVFGWCKQVKLNQSQPSFIHLHKQIFGANRNKQAITSTRTLKL